MPVFVLGYTSRVAHRAAVEAFANAVSNDGGMGCKQTNPSVRNAQPDVRMLRMPADSVVSFGQNRFISVRYSRRFSESGDTPLPELAAPVHGRYSSSLILGSRSSLTGPRMGRR